MRAFAQTLCTANWIHLSACRTGCAYVFFVILLVTVQGCSQTALEPEPAFSPGGDRVEALPLNTATEAAAEAADTPAPSPSPSLPSPSPSPGDRRIDTPDSGLIRQGAMFGILDPYQVDDIAIGGYKHDTPFCGEPSLTDLPVESGEIVLTLQYATPLLPEQIEVYAGEKPEGIRRIGLLNSASGLGRLIYESGSSIRREPLAEGACSNRLIFSTSVDFEVDTIIIAFEDAAGASQVGAVEILGRLEGFVELPVFWRVPLPGTPVDIAAGQNGLVFAATSPNGLYAYDVEGNQLKQYAAPSRSVLSSVAADQSGNLIVTDIAFGWFIIISPQGEHLTVGGEDSYYRSAVNPVDGNLYLLKNHTIFVYTIDTAELVRQIPLDDMHDHVCMEFNSQGDLYILRDHEWSSNLIVLDPLSGEEIDTIPLERSAQIEIVARDFAIDASGDIYVLFGMNAGQIAVHQLDARGNFLKRFGKLSSDPGGWPEGEFLDPRAITVSPEGRFIIVADGFDQSAYLTAFLVEPP